MITNQPNWSGSFGLVVTSTGYGADVPDSVPAVGTSGVTLPFLLQYQSTKFGVHQYITMSGLNVDLDTAITMKYIY